MALPTTTSTIPRVTEAPVASVTLRPPSRMILLLLLLFTPSQAYSAYFADFSALAQDREPTCVPIPQNMSLCSNIGYTKMRLPNLLEHDTIQEASSQATYWVPLTHAQCAEDTQLFLCSLFAPVCLERPIYPCRSLCQKVKAGCEEKMSSQGYPWPSMLDCDKFPLDNDMCITSQAEAQQGRQSEKGKLNIWHWKKPLGAKKDLRNVESTTKNSFFCNEKLPRLGF